MHVCLHESLVHTHVVGARTHMDTRAHTHGHARPYTHTLNPTPAHPQVNRNMEGQSQMKLGIVHRAMAIQAFLSAAQPPASSDRRQTAADYLAKALEMLGKSETLFVQVVVCACAWCVECVRVRVVFCVVCVCVRFFVWESTHLQKHEALSLCLSHKDKHPPTYPPPHTHPCT